MKALLIHPPWLRFFGGSLSIAPMALNAIACYVRRETPHVDIDVYNADHCDKLDPLFSSHSYATLHGQYLKRLNDFNDPIWQAVARTIDTLKPDVVGISAMTASFPSALNVARIVKNIDPGIQVLMGGKHPSALPVATLQHLAIDVVAIGEGEETFKELLEHGHDRHRVHGIAFRDGDGGIVRTPARPPVADINTLPIPVFKSAINRYDFEKGINLASYKWRIIGARGCPFKCVYCASDKRIRYRSPEHIMAEIDHVIDRFGIRTFRFEDDSFSLNRKRALDLCARMAERGITWECNTRVDLVDRQLVAAMKTSGCELVWLGIETGSDATARRINKQISHDMVLDAIRLFKQHHIMVCGYFMIGFPWERKADMLQTLALIKALPLDDFELNLTTPLPGTELFETLVREGRIDVATEDWSRYHQGSPDMNFSRYPDDVWKAIVMDLTRQASRLHRHRMVIKTVKLFLNDPVVTFKRASNRLRDSRYWDIVRKLLS
ncbi:MAG: radical SAM protein [Pseudomonadota bacterium]